jgi:hypothetical protein
MMEKKQQQQDKVDDKELYVNVVRGKCRAEEIKGTLLKVAGRGGVFGLAGCRGRTSLI